MATILVIFKKIGFTEEYIKSLTWTLLNIPLSDGSANAFKGAVDKASDSNPESGWLQWLAILKSEPSILSELPDPWKVIPNEINRDKLATEVMLHNFNLTERKLYEVILAILQLQFFSKRFYNSTGYTNMHEYDTLTFMPEKLRSIFSGFGLAKTVIPDCAYKPDIIFLHAANEKALYPRIATLLEIVAKNLNPSDKISVYFVTNPRGLCTCESSTAEILATWFSSDQNTQKQITEIIKLVFKKNFARDRSIQYEWFKDLEYLQQEILEHVNTILPEKLITFPQNPDQNIHYSQEYDLAAEMEQRTKLNNSWPIINHLLKFLISSENIDLKIIPVCGELSNAGYVPARTADLTKFFAKNCLPKYVEQYDRPIELLNISDQSVTMSGLRQHLITKFTVRKYLPEAKINISQAYDGALLDNIDIERALKEVTATLHTIYTFGQETLLRELESEPSRESSYSMTSF